MKASFVPLLDVHFQVVESGFAQTCRSPWPLGSQSDKHICFSTLRLKFGKVLT